jgi:hypothetical protein
MMAAAVEKESAREDDEEETSTLADGVGVMMPATTSPLSCVCGCSEPAGLEGVSERKYITFNLKLKFCILFVKKIQKFKI